MNWRSKHCFIVSFVCMGLFASAQDSKLKSLPINRDLHVKGDSVGFDLYRDHLILVRASLGRLTDLNFLVDTGADQTVLNQRLADRLQLQQKDAGIEVLNGKVAARTAVLPQLEIGPIRINGLQVMIRDLTSLDRALHVRVDGSIGLDVLRQSSFVINYKAKKISFGEPPVMPHSVPFQLDQGLVMVDVTVNTQPVRLLVDTGSTSVILFATRIKGRLPTLQVRKVGLSENLAGPYERKEVLLLDVRLGDLRLGQQFASVVDDRKAPRRDFDGLLSPYAMGFKEVSVDFQRRTFGWGQR